MFSRIGEIIFRWCICRPQNILTFIHPKRKHWNHFNYESLMQVSKFGGASAKSADAVKNLFKIVESLDKPQVIVVSAMGKMTNAFETLAQYYFSGNRVDCKNQLQQIKDYHHSIIMGLFGDFENAVLSPFFECVRMLEGRLEQFPSMHFDYEYDQIVSFGEMFSTHIISAYLNYSGVSNKWVDVRQVLKTDDFYRDANVDWEMTTKLMNRTFTFSDTSCM